MSLYSIEKLDAMAGNLRACSVDSCSECGLGDYSDCSERLMKEAACVVEDFARSIKLDSDTNGAFVFNEDKNAFEKLGDPIEFVCTTSSNVNHPSHYNTGSIEVWDAIVCWQLDFLLGNVIKYIARAGHKGNKLEDLRKAQKYINKAIDVEEKHEQDNS